MSAGQRELLADLPEENTGALLDALRRMERRGRLRRWSSVVGSLSHADAGQMRRAVEEGCERVHPDGPVEAGGGADSELAAISDVSGAPKDAPGDTGRGR